MKAAVSEANLAAVVVAWLEALGADVYQEVEILRRGIRADIVARVRAGAPTGGHWTPFRSTCEQLVRTVRAAGSEGITLKEAIATKYHYASIAGARSSLATWIKDGRLPGVRLEAGRLYAVEVAP